MEDIPEAACYTQIVRISCLLVYFDFELTPDMQVRFENGKELLKVGNNDDFVDLYFKLKDIADGLESDIEYYSGLYEDFTDYSETENNPYYNFY